MTAIRDSACDALSSDADKAARQRYRCHGDALHSYVARFCPDWATAEDIVQETFRVLGSTGAEALLTGSARPG